MVRKYIILIFCMLMVTACYALTGDITIEGRLGVVGNISVLNLFGNGSNITNLNALNIYSGTLSDARLSINVVTPEAGQIFTNKTISNTSNTITANSIKNLTTNVSVSAAASPSAGQYLMATNSTMAAWADPPTIESRVSTEATLTTRANQMVMVWAKGNVVPGTTAQVLTLECNGVQKAVWLTSAAAATTTFPFALMFTEVRAATTETLRVRVSGGTMGNVKITVLKAN